MVALHHVTYDVSSQLYHVISSLPYLGGLFLLEGIK